MPRPHPFPHERVGSGDKTRLDHIQIITVYVILHIIEWDPCNVTFAQQHAHSHNAAIGYSFPQEPIQEEQANNYLATPIDPHNLHRTEHGSWLVG